MAEVIAGSDDERKRSRERIAGVPQARRRVSEVQSETDRAYAVRFFTAGYEPADMREMEAVAALWREDARELERRDTDLRDEADRFFNGGSSA